MTIHPHEMFREYGYLLCISVRFRVAHTAKSTATAERCCILKAIYFGDGLPTGIGSVRVQKMCGPQVIPRDRVHATILD